MQTEFLRSLHANYERILLDENPEEKRYQYCILNRGGIKGLLPCSLRYMNGLAYLYYDITSKQNMAQLYEKRLVDREWMKNFMWSFTQIRLELARFLLDIQNVLWYPDQIFQDLDSNVFSFVYVPYYKGEDSFKELLEYLIEHIDYEDESLVETVYKMYDHYDKIGFDYLQGQIFEDAKLLEQVKAAESADLAMEEAKALENVKNEEMETQPASSSGKPSDDTEEWEEAMQSLERNEKRGIRSLFDPKKKRAKSDKGSYQKELQLSMSTYIPPSYKVAEDDYGEDYGQTIYIAETENPKAKQHRLYTAEGQILVQLDNPVYTIGKKKDEVEVVLEDASISRMHARILRDQDNYFVEDLNSTNGTYKNGLRMQPYEKRKLEEGDEIRLGKITLMFR